MSYKITIQLTVEHVEGKKVPRWRAAEAFRSKAEELFMRLSPHNGAYVVRESRLRKPLSR